MEHIIDQVRASLRESADEKTKSGSQHFFKEKILFYGVKVPSVQKIARSCFKQISAESKSVIFDLCDVLWESGYIEESFVACEWAYALRKQYEPADFVKFEKWISHDVNNWASCDTLCNHTVGDFVMIYPDYLSRLKEFAKSDNRWMRRAAAVTLIIPARKGLFLEDILEIADTLLQDGDDLVQKGYGWMLKAASESHCREIFDFVMQRKAVMPRTALRYAIEKMPADMKKEAMLK